MRTRPAAATLIKQDHPKDRRVEIAAHRRAAPTPWTAMQDDDRDAVGISALFDIDAVAIGHDDDALIERVDRRIEKFDCALLA
jgi:hypothetical protein